MKQHLSENQISDWIAGQPGREAERHVKDCPKCAREIAGTKQALARFRDSGHECAEYWTRQPRVPRVRALGLWAAITVALAAGILGAVIVLNQPLPTIVPPRQVFTQIPYVVPPAPYERTAVVRMRLPVAALIAAGFRMEISAADAIPADVLLGQDGRPLAVAFPENNQ